MKKAKKIELTVALEENTDSSSKPSVKKRANSSETRNKILDTADRLFYEKGIKSVGIDTIIAESGVAKMSLYHHFPSKEKLIIEYLEERDKGFFKNFELYLDNETTEDPITEYFSFLKKELFKDCSLHCPFLNVIVEFPDMNNNLHEVIIKHKIKIKTKLQTTLERLGYKNSLKKAEQITLIWHGLLINLQIFGKKYDIENFFELLKVILKK